MRFEQRATTNTNTHGAAIRCPHLPEPWIDMDYRVLRRPDWPDAASSYSVEIWPLQWQFEQACRYAHFLWLKGYPARAILALCRAIYLVPDGLNPATEQPYAAYVWMLRQADPVGFFGNPRISFAHQAMRMRSAAPLKRCRAWAMWRLTLLVREDLPADPMERETPPEDHVIRDQLNQIGLPMEGETWWHQLAGGNRQT